MYNYNNRLQDEIVINKDYNDDIDLNSKQNAIKLAKKIFFTLSKNKKILVFEDFLGHFEDNKKAKEAFEFFDKDNNGDISKSELKYKIVQIYQERKDIALALQDMSQVVGKLDKLILLIILIFLILIWLFMLGFPIFTELLSFGTFFLGLSFIFSENAKNLFQSIIFIFVMHPFDSGDRVYIDNENFLVTKVGLLGTTLFRIDGQKIYIPNHMLSTKYIYNIRRSESQAEEISNYKK